MLRHISTAIVSLILLAGAARASDLPYKYTGYAPSLGFGRSVTDLGDVNADGRPDFAAVSLWGSHEFYQLRVQVFSGMGPQIKTVETTHSYSADVKVARIGDVTDDGRAELLLLTPDSVMVIDIGSSGHNWKLIEVAAGSSIAGLGDVDKDGRPDFAVGYPYAKGGRDNSELGKVVVYSGDPAKDGKALATFWGNQAGAQFGYSVSDCGDVDKKGKPDLIIGAPKYAGKGGAYGKAVVMSWETKDPILTCYGSAGGDRCGHSVSGAGDVNQDYVPDVIVGIPYADNGSYVDAGKVKVLSGADGATLATFTTASLGSLFGYSVSDVGDMNKDGKADIVIGAPASVWGGTVSVYSVMDKVLIKAKLADSSGDGFGACVSGAGDLQGDGYVDFLCGAPNDDVKYSNSGTVHAFSGNPWSGIGGEEEPEGWAGTLGIPRLEVIEGATCAERALSMENSRGQPTPAVLFFGFSAARLATEWDSALLVGGPLTALPIALPPGTLTLDLGGLCQEGLSGQTLHMQVLELDPGASRGVSFSGRASIDLGSD